MPKGEGTYGSVKGRPPKKKKRLKKISIKSIKDNEALSGEVVAKLVALKAATKGKSKKEKLKLVGTTAASAYVGGKLFKIGSKAYNKYIDKINKKRGY